MLMEMLWGCRACRRAPPPVLFAAPGTPKFFSPLDARETARRAAQPVLFCAALVFKESRRASRRAVAVFFQRRAALSSRLAARTVSQLLAGGRIASGRSPGAARVRGLRGHARRRRIPSRCMTPHEAPSWEGIGLEYVPIT
jgi:hypothetical protein